MPKVEEILTKILNALTRSEKTQLDAPYLVNRYRHLNRSEKVKISSKPVFMDRVIVSKGGDQCVLTLFDGTNEIFKGVLNDEFLRKGNEMEPYSIKISTEIQNELRAELYSPKAVSHYKMNSVTGTVVVDSGSNKSNGVFTNGVNADWVQGKIFNALNFDGVDAYVDCGNINASLFSASKPLSISVWLYKEGSTGYQYIIAKYDGTKGLVFNFDNNTDILFIRFIVAGTIIGIKCYTNLTLNTWHHVVATYDGSKLATGFRLYVDRTVMATIIANVGTLTGDCSGITDMNIGCSGTVDNFIDGKIDDLRIYDVVLSSEQVSLIYNQGKGTEEEFNIADVILTYKENIIPTKALEVT